MIANLAPARTAELTALWEKGDTRGARDAYFRLLPLCRAMFLETNPIPVKTALALMGKLEGGFRLPLTPMAPGNVEKLSKVLELYGLERK